MERGESAIGLLNLKGQDIVLSGGIKSSPKGFWAEFVFSTVLIQIAKYLGGKPITSHPMFSNLNGTIFDKYTIDVNEPLFSPDGWQTLLTPTIGPNGEITIVNTNLIALQLDLNLRWDIFVLLKKCNDLENIPTYTFMIVNSKLECDISCDDFCNNILASQPENGYINATGKILNVEKKKLLNTLLEPFKNSTPLCISFIYGDFPNEINPTYTWNENNNQFLIIDKTNYGFIKELPQSTINLFEVFSNSSTDINNKEKTELNIILQLYKEKMKNNKQLKRQNN